MCLHCADSPVLTRTVKEIDEDKTVAGEVKSPIKDAPGWDEKLASDSEASVRGLSQHGLPLMLALCKEP